jgi:uncharacterized OsmC-like protein
MTLISIQLKNGVQEMIGKLRSLSDPQKSVVATNANARLTGPQTSEAKIRDFTVISDEPKSVDGRDSGPAPSTYFIASIGFAENVILARQAALANVDFDACETSVTGHWDMKGLYEIDGAEPSFRDILIETRVTTKASPEKFVELLRLTDKRNPVTATIKKATHVSRKLFVNEAEVHFSP